MKKLINNPNKKWWQIWKSDRIAVELSKEDRKSIWLLIKEEQFEKEKPAECLDDIARAIGQEV